MSKQIKVIIASHNFLVDADNIEKIRLVERYNDRFIHWGTKFDYVRRQNIRTVFKVFATKRKIDENHYHFRIHINQFRDFEVYCLGVGISLIKSFQKINIKKIKPFNLKLIDDIKYRKAQIPAIKYGVKSLPISKLIGLDTGAGKSLIALDIIAKLNMRAMLIINPKFIDKWLDDIKKWYKVEDFEKEVMVVAGSPALIKLTNLINSDGDDRINPSIIIVSNKTLYNYFKRHRSGEDVLEYGYGCLPNEFFEHCGCGIRLIDEVHMDFHSNFVIDLYTNCLNVVSLTGTLSSDDPFIEKMQCIAYPMDTRYLGIKGDDKYILTYEALYKFKNPRDLKYSYNTNNFYSHQLVEKFILKDYVRTANYFKLIKECIMNTFLSDYIKGDKCAIYCTLTTMSTKLRDYLIKEFPDLDIRRYMADDPYDNLIQPDITITSIGSAGTGQDIPGLTALILTIALNSSITNIQTMGRLRKLADTKEIDPMFCWFTCVNIPKHINYSEKKLKVLENKTIKHEVFYKESPYVI